MWVMSSNDNQKVKIIATLGPASDSRAMIVKLAEEGVDIFRLNLSHYRKGEFPLIIKRIRFAERKVGRSLTVLGDLAGSKIRIGSIAEEGMILKEGQKIKILSKLTKKSTDAISLNFPTAIKGLERGAEIYLGDGLIKLEVQKKITGGVIAKVVVGGSLRSWMGFAAQGRTSKRFSLSLQEVDDIKALVKAGVDALAISFVKNSKNIEEVKHALPRGHRPLLIAKIETVEGVKSAESILDAADGLMIARGDLGLSAPMAEIASIQKDLIDLALKMAKPVITATQLLESMIHKSLPTRAEVTDVANAILDGSDAVMLSGETAVGKFPVETVNMMEEIVDSISDRIVLRSFPEDESVYEAMSASVIQIADRIKARLIIVFTESGSTARQIARHRCRQPIIALSPNRETIRALNFTWGVFPRLAGEKMTFDELIEGAREVALNNDIVKLKRGDLFVVSAGVPFGKAGTTNFVLIQKV